MKKQNIRVSRYNATDALEPGVRCGDGKFRWEASIQPDDGSWVLFVPTADAAAEGLGPQLWHLVGTIEVNGATEEAYALEGSDEHRAYVDAFKAA